ncbi:hypothetical protein GZ212_10465 [Mangrovimonas sp. CR14]|uniref:hypothetical protein n=1 Tax=Mangrovimonas sp. CR14 TaxID=2706120 RepID=UPI0014240AE4|nr:hypothetical protein [Mangrovimonas sp. CR14]NIK92572.1 hypothetical protein [Mangrovimonas sp. CR14]
MKQSFKLFLFLLLLSSCDFGRKGIEVKVENTTKSTLHNISVIASPQSYVIFDSIAPNETTTKFLDMKETNILDGSFTLNFTYPDGEKATQTFGYHNNGFPNNYLICCKINKMTAYVAFDRYCD